jgi:hypothetical protein
MVTLMAIGQDFWMPFIKYSSVILSSPDPSIAGVRCPMTPEWIKVRKQHFGTLHQALTQTLKIEYQT